MKNIATFLSLVLLGLNTIAQVPTEKTLLWEISGNGIQKSSYLYGTIHLMCPDDLKVPGVVKEKFNHTEELFLEIDMDDPKMMNEMMAGMMMKDSSTIKNLLGDAAYTNLNKLFTSQTGMPLEIMQKAKPMMLMALVYPSMLGCQPDSWEKTFQTMAEAKGLNIAGLEKLSDQLNVIEKIPYKVQANMLLELLQNMDSSKTAFNNLIEVYKSKDIHKLHELTTSDKDFGQYEATMLNDRNKNWIPVISSQSKLKPTFYAVGAAHLGGESGVINLLRKDGFIVKPVMY